MAKDDKKLLLVAHEIKLVKVLAGNNKKLRERTIKRLSKWLTDRSNSAPLTEDALMRIWKGLFYAMWMSDKPLIQEDCAEKIANLIHLNDVKASLLFFKCFLQTMLNEWYGIDQHRIDKFLMLIRRVFRQMFEVLHQNEWEKNSVNQFREILNQTALKIDKNTALGLCLHIDDIFLEELAKTSKGNIDGSQVLQLIQPFAQQLARVDDKRQIQHIVNNIFKHLINQTDVAIEYREKFHAWKRQGFPGGSIDAMECIENEENSEEIEGNLDDLPKDPRAGKVDVLLPQLNFDPLEVISLLEGIRFKKYTTSKGRKAISKLIKQFKLLSEGIYPLGLTKIEDVRDKNISVKKSVKRLQHFEHNLKHDSKKAKQKALKHKKAQEILFKQLEKTDSPNNKKLRQKKAKTIEEFIEKSEGHLLNKIPTKTKQKKVETIEKFIAKSEGHILNKIPTKTKQKKAETIEEFIAKSEGHILNKTPTKTKQKKVETIEELIAKSEGRKIPIKKRKIKQLKEENTPKKKKIKEINLGISPEKLVPIKSQIHFRRCSGMWTVDEFEDSESPKSDISDWEKPLQNGETEIFVVSKKSKKKLKRLADAKKRPVAELIDDFTNKMMKTTPKRSNIVKNPFSGGTTPRSEKKIKFSKQVQAQEFQDHEQSIINSPVIPYDANKQPTKSLLKPSPYKSPVNPFYHLNN